LWSRQRRVRQLAEELAQTRAEQTELRRRLELFEAIAGAAGAALPDAGWWGRVVPSAPMPPGLLAAAGEETERDAAVRLEVSGTDVIAVVGGPGDPREWWSAVWHLAGTGAAS
jgi:hypothetical protein